MGIENFSAELPKEKVKEAAIRVGDRIFTGQMHYVAYLKAKDEIPDLDNLGIEPEQGFVTSTGRFVGRDEAGRLADSSGQLKHLSEQENDSAVIRLDSHNLEGTKKLIEDWED